MRTTVWIIAAIIIFFTATFARFISDIPRNPVGDSVTTDAIVVLTGGSLRLSYGFELLAKEKAEKLFISGVYDEADLASLMDKHSAPSILKSRRDVEQIVILDHVADSTRKNAVETAKWVKREGVRSIRLVTANYHLPRSLVEFNRTMPDVIIVPDPVFPSQFTLKKWWQNDVSRPLILSEFLKYIAVWIRWDLFSAEKSYPS